MPKRTKKSRSCQRNVARRGDFFARDSQRKEGDLFEAEDVQDTDSSGEVASSQDEKCWEEDVEVSDHDSDDEACASLIETLRANSARSASQRSFYVGTSARNMRRKKGLA